MAWSAKARAAAAAKRKQRKKINPDLVNGSGTGLTSKYRYLPNPTWGNIPARTRKKK
jgi:hypothetical protein